MDNEFVITAIQVYPDSTNRPHRIANDIETFLYADYDNIGDRLQGWRIKTLEVMDDGYPDGSVWVFKITLVPDHRS